MRPSQFYVLPYGTSIWLGSKQLFYNQQAGENTRSNTAQVLRASRWGEMSSKITTLLVVSAGEPRMCRNDLSEVGLSQNQPQIPPNGLNVS